MRTAVTDISEAVGSLRGIPARTRVSRSQRREPVPPPIFLCKQNQTPIRAANPVPNVAEPITKKPPFKVSVRLSAPTAGTGANVLHHTSGLLSLALNWIRERRSGRSRGRRLKVTETVSLGDKRFIAVVQMDGIQYLVGGGATNVTLLAQLKENEPFQNLLKEALSAPEQHTAEPLIEQLGQQI